MTLDSPEFWIALAQIIGINIVLSGDNAVVIALAARSLPPKQQKQAVLWGSGAAVVMRILLTVVAVELLKLPWLKLIGAVLLFWIAIKLLAAGVGGRRRRQDGRQHGRRGQDHPDRRPGDEPRQRHRGGGRGQGQPAAAHHRPRDLDPAGDLRQHAAARADGALPDHHHDRRRAPRLGGGRDDDLRPGGEGLDRRQRGVAALRGPGGGRGGGRRDRQAAREAARGGAGDTRRSRGERSAACGGRRVRRRNPSNGGAHVQPDPACRRCLRQRPARRRLRDRLCERAACRCTRSTSTS